MPTIKCPYCSDNNMPMPPKTARPFGKCPNCGKKSRAAISDSMDGKKTYVHYSATSLPKLDDSERKEVYSIRLSKRDIEDVERNRKFIAVYNGSLQLLYKT